MDVILLREVDGTCASVGPGYGERGGEEWGGRDRIETKGGQQREGGEITIVIRLQCRIGSCLLALLLSSLSDRKTMGPCEVWQS